MKLVKELGYGNSMPEALKLGSALKKSEHPEKLNATPCPFDSFAYALERPRKLTGVYLRLLLEP